MKVARDLLDSGSEFLAPGSEILEIAAGTKHTSGSGQKNRPYVGTLVADNCRLEQVLAQLWIERIGSIWPVKRNTRNTVMNLET